MVAAACVITYKVQGKSIAYDDQFSLFWKIGDAAISYIAYLLQFFWPANLAVSYPRRPLDLPLWEVWGSLLILSAATAAAFACRRRRPYWLVGWLWYLGMFVPIIGLLQFGAGDGNDRFTYFPQIGIGMALAWGLADLCGGQSRRRWALGAASVAVLLILMGCAWRQTAYWHDSESLWRHALACNERDGFAQGGLGTTLHRAGRIDEAIAHYQKAVAIRPDDSVYNNLGGIFAGRRQYDKAVACFEWALKISPDYAAAHNNLGHILVERGRLDEAVAHFRQALKSDPDNSDIHSRLGDALHRQGRDAQAVAPCAWRFGGRRPISTIFGRWRCFWRLRPTRPFAAARKPSNWPSGPFNFPAAKPRSTSARWPPRMLRPDNSPKPSRLRKRPSPSLRPKKTPCWPECFASNSNCTNPDRPIARDRPIAPETRPRRRSDARHAVRLRRNCPQAASIRSPLRWRTTTVKPPHSNSSTNRAVAADRGAR